VTAATRRRRMAPRPPLGPPDQAATDALRTRLTVDQPPRAVAKHVPQNTHVPGSMAYAVTGGRVIR
jgi:hypothetical protein